MKSVIFAAAMASAAAFAPSQQVCQIDRLRNFLVGVSPVVAKVGSLVTWMLTLHCAQSYTRIMRSFNSLPCNNS